MNCTYCNHPTYVHDYRNKCNVPGCDCIYDHDSAQLSALEVCVDELRTENKRLNIAIDEVKVILADCPFESWWKVGMWMEKYGVDPKEII